MKISERVTELLLGNEVHGRTGMTWTLFSILAALDEYQAETEKRLQEIMREAQTSKPFYDQSGGGALDGDPRNRKAAIAGVWADQLGRHFH